MLEIIITFFTSILDISIGTALKAKEKKSSVAKELYTLYGLIVEAKEEIASAQSYLNKFLTEGIAGPTGEPIISCGNRLAEIANSYIKYLRCGGNQHLLSSIFDKISSRHDVNIKTIALFDEELAIALCNTINAEISVHNNFFNIPSFRGDSRGKIEKIEFDMKKIKNLTAYLNVTDVSSFVKVTKYDLRAGDQKQIKDLNKYLTDSLNILSDAKYMLREFIKSNYRIEDLL